MGIGEQRKLQDGGKDASLVLMIIRESSLNPPLRVHEILFRHPEGSGFKPMVSYLVTKTIRSNGRKAESERQEDNAEEAIIKDLGSVPSHQQMLAFTNTEQHAAFWKDRNEHLAEE